MTTKTVNQLNIIYTNSPYIFKTDWQYSVNGNYYSGIFVYTALTDYPQLNTSSSSGGDSEK